MDYIIEDFKPEPGLHCISNSIKQIFHHNGHMLSEEMIFGLSSMLSFMYFHFKNMSVPIIGGRGKIGEMEKNLADRLGIEIKSHETSSAKKAYKTLLEVIKSGRAAVTYVDMYYLPYFDFPEVFHFGGHAIVVFGILEDEGMALVSDRDGDDYPATLNENDIPKDFHKISLDVLQKARGSKEKPYPPKNRRLEFDFEGYRDPDRDMIFDAIAENAEVFLNPPIKNLGIKGIDTFGKKLSEWEDFDDETLKYAAFNCFIMIDEKGGTGGGCFRRMYGRFLEESSRLAGSEFLRRAGDSYIRLACKWDEIGSGLYKIFETGDRNLLPEISDKVKLLYIKENEIMNQIKEYVESNPCCK
jgi:hypothetical protein